MDDSASGREAAEEAAAEAVGRRRSRNNDGDALGEEGLLGGRSSEQLREPLLLSPTSDFDADVTAEGKKRRTIGWLKVLYFFMAVGPSSWGRYAPVFYNACGLSPGKIGLVEGLMPFTRALATPFWGWIADSSVGKKKVALLTQFCGVGVLMAFAVPKVPFLRSFAGILTVSAGSAAFASSGVVDSYALEALGEAERGRFGEIRLWSAVSWGLCNAVMGYVADATTGFQVNLYVFFGCTVATLCILAFTLPAKIAQQPILHEKTPSLYGALTPQSCFFFFELVIFGAAMAVVERLLFVYIINDLEGSYFLCGLTVVFTVAVEVPVFAVSNSLLRTIGHDAMFALAILCYIPRVLAYTILTPKTKYFILLVEMLHGPTFALMYAAAVDYTALIAPRGLEARFQTLQQAARGCLGAGIGVLAAGYFWELECAHRRRPNCKLGAVRLYRWVGAIMSLTLSVHLLKVALQRAGRRRKLSSNGPDSTPIVMEHAADDDDNTTIIA